MKNKHLILIFILTLASGLGLKFLPWFKSNVLHTKLIDIAPGTLEKISIYNPGNAELTLEKNDDGWVVTQDDLTIRAPDSLADPMAAALANMFSIRLLHSNRPDTLGLAENHAIHLEILMKNGRRERLKIGKQILENNEPATWIEIAEHEGIYLVHNHLRPYFLKKLDDFRRQSLLEFDAAGIQQALIQIPGVDTIQLQQQDSLIGIWAKELNRMNGLPFVSGFDENDDRHRLLAKINLELSPEDAVWVRFFTGTGKSKIERPPEIVIQSSGNPTAYFLLRDTLLLRSVLFPGR